MSVSQEECPADDGDVRAVHHKTGDKQSAECPVQGHVAWLRPPAGLRELLRCLQPHV